MNAINDGQTEATNHLIASPWCYCNYDFQLCDRSPVVWSIETWCGRKLVNYRIDSGGYYVHAVAIIPLSLFEDNTDKQRPRGMTGWGSPRHSALAGGSSTPPLRAPTSPWEQPPVAANGQFMHCMLLLLYCYFWISVLHSIPLVF